MKTKESRKYPLLALVTGLAVFAALSAMPGTARGDIFASINITSSTDPFIGSIYEYTAEGAQSTFASGFSRPHGLAFDAAGNLFFTSTKVDDAGNWQGSIFKITPDGTMSTFAAGFPSNFFVNPVAFDSAGNLFVTAGNFNDPNLANTIYKITPDGTVSPFGLQSDCVQQGTNVNCSTPGQNFGLAFDSTGNLFVSDNVYQIIYKFSPEGVRSIFVGPEAFTPTESPIVLAFDESGNLFASSADNVAGDGAILKFAQDGTKTIFATGLSDEPRGLAFDNLGNLFVAEVIQSGPGDILEFTPAGALYQPTPTGTPGVFASGIGRTKGNGGPEFLAFTTGAITPPSSAVALTFPNATSPLTTSVTSVDQNSVPPPPSNFELTGSNLAFEITTPSAPTPPIIIAFTVPSSLDVSTLKALHYECDTQNPPNCNWVDRTIDSTDPNYPSNPAPNTIYGSVSSLSPFLIAKFKFGAQVQQPINADGTSVFNAKRGVIPVAFKLTSDGVATCQLPPATISVFRTSGGVVGSIDESTYLLKSDSGSNFRIDSTKCQYVYNLGASSLGPGTYQAYISIGGSVAGSATFALK